MSRGNPRTVTQQAHCPRRIRSPSDDMLIAGGLRSPTHLRCVSSPLKRNRVGLARHKAHRLLRVPPTGCSCERARTQRGAARAPRAGLWEQAQPRPIRLRRIGARRSAADMQRAAGTTPAANVRRRGMGSSSPSLRPAPKGPARRRQYIQTRRSRRATTGCGVKRIRRASERTSAAREPREAQSRHPIPTRCNPRGRPQASPAA